MTGGCFPGRGFEGPGPSGCEMGSDARTPSDPQDSGASEHGGLPACDGPAANVPLGVPDAGVDLPPDFTPVDGPLPEWIDIRQVCKEARRFVALHVLSTFNAVAINDGRRVYTANDR